MVVGGPFFITQYVDRVLGTVLSRIGGDHQTRLDPQLRVEDWNVGIGPGMDFAHPTNTDEPHSNGLLFCHDFSSLRSFDRRIGPVHR
jgi:hypothetical protein